MSDPRAAVPTITETGTEVGSPAGRPGSLAGALAVWNPEAGGSTPTPPAVAARYRRQGLIQALVAAAIGTLIFFAWHREVAYVVFGIAALTLLAALLSPTGVYAAIRRGLEWFGYWVGRLLTVLLLVPLFYGFFALFGRLLRRGRRDRMQRWFDPEAASYWKLRHDGERTLEHYERQF